MFNYYSLHYFYKLTRYVIIYFVCDLLNC